jgi:hypothetical protein
MTERRAGPTRTPVKGDPSPWRTDGEPACRSCGGEAIFNPAQGRHHDEHIKVEGIGEVYAQQLLAAGVRTAEALLAEGGTPKGRQEIAEKTGIGESLILRWVNHIDLFRIKGVAGQYAELLEAALLTRSQLAQRNGDNPTRPWSLPTRNRSGCAKLPAPKQVSLDQHASGCTALSSTDQFVPHIPLPAALREEGGSKSKPQGHRTSIKNRAADRRRGRAMPQRRSQRPDRHAAEYAELLTNPQDMALVVQKAATKISKPVTRVSEVHATTASQSHSRVILTGIAQDLALSPRLEAWFQTARPKLLEPVTTAPVLAGIVLVLSTDIKIVYEKRGGKKHLKVTIAKQPTSEKLLGKIIGLIR